MKKFLLSGAFLSVLVISAFAQNSLLIAPNDIRIEKTANGCNLFIRKKPGLESVMLTETTKDPLGKEDNYAYRAREWNSVNGDERRLLDGEFIDSKEKGLYFLIDSTPQDDAQFGKAFLIFIPEELLYGYDWSRHGTVQVGMGTFINIRGFEKPYCDYTGNYFDNPYMFNLEKRTRPRPTPAPQPEPESVTEVILTDDYNPIAADKFKEFSDMVIYSKARSLCLTTLATRLPR